MSAPSGTGAWIAAVAAKRRTCRCAEVWRAGLLGMSLAGALAGCGSSQFAETHFFKQPVFAGDGTPVGGKANYYRLKIEGHTFFASSRFVSGFFDAEIIDNYFNEITQPQSGQIKPPPSKEKIASNAVAKAADDQVHPERPQTTQINQTLGTETPLTNTSLVLLLSTNADAIADQIGILTRTKESINSIALLANRDKLDNLDQSDTRVQSQTLIGKNLAALGDALIAKTDGTDAVATRANMLTYANALVRSLGGPGNFTSLDDVEKWLTAERASILAGGTR